MIRLQYEAREDYYRTQNDLKELMKRRDIKLAELNTALKEKDATIEKYLAIMAGHGIQPE